MVVGGREIVYLKVMCGTRQKEQDPKRTGNIGVVFLRVSFSGMGV